MANQSRILPFLAISLGLFLLAVLWLMFATPEAPKDMVTHDIALPAPRPVAVKPLLPMVGETPAAAPVQTGKPAGAGAAPDE